LLAEVASVTSQVAVVRQVFRGHAVAEPVVRQAMPGAAAVRHRLLPLGAEAGAEVGGAERQRTRLREEH
jgi:hypothetical protein